MAMLANRSPAGFCLCKRCVKPDERRKIRKRNRLREERQWRGDVRDDDYSPEWLPWWELMALWEAEYGNGGNLPPGFDGVWSTESGDVSHG